MSDYCHLKFEHECADQHSPLLSLSGESTLGHLQVYIAALWLNHKADCALSLCLDTTGFVGIVVRLR